MTSPETASAPAAPPEPPARLRRVAARAVDVVLTAMAAVAVAAAVHAVGGPSGAAAAAALLVAATYELAGTARGGTAGKRLFGLELRGPDGGRPGLARAWLRFAALSPLLLGALAGIPAALRRRPLPHDRVAGTRLVPVGARLSPHRDVAGIGAGDAAVAGIGAGDAAVAGIGAGDALVAVFAGAWCSSLAGLVAALGGSRLGPEVVFGLLVPAQATGALLCVAASSRAKGSGSWAADYGWVLRPKDVRFALLGPLMHLAVAAVVTPLLRLLDRPAGPSQDVVRDLGGLDDPVLAVVAVLGVAVLAPAVEEIVFRGVLLRALLRRGSEQRALAVSSGLFAAAHLLDPGSWPLLPGLALLGWMLGVLTVRSGTLSRAVFAHAGFNLVAAGAVLAS